MDNKKPFYITTPIYYVNDVPHIGHAYTSLACDVIARYMRLDNREVRFLTGTDEHGQKVEKSAEKASMLPQEFVDKNSESFRDMNNYMNYSNDDFIRTTDQRHNDAAQMFWQKLQENGDIYLEKYSGWYSVRDEAFFAESELTEDGKAPTGAEVEWVEEPSYFFALSKWQDKLLAHYEQNPDFIKPESRRNEVISFVKSGLRDLSISRTSFKWGIQVPNDNEHVMYVWLDALTNYLSALGYGSGQDELLKKFWPADAHVVGKDILRFHAVYWPAFLMSAGIELPKTIMAHGWWTSEGEKISKSVGNVIDPKELVGEFGVDQVRYFLMREVIFGNDGNYAPDNLIQRNNSELSNKIGNLIQRTCSFIYKNCDRKVPEVSEEFINKMYESDEFVRIQQIISQNTDSIERLEINKVMDNIIKLAEIANSFIDSEAPWKLKNDNPERMNEVLYQLMEIIRYIAILLQPFVPESANRILQQLIIPEDERMLSCMAREFAFKPGHFLQEPQAIFPRL